MKKLIICEKPSLARNVMEAITIREKFTKKDGYYESNNYIISWCFGHLLELKNVNEYEGKKIQWNDIKLPFIPEKFQYKIKNDSGIIKQFKILKEWIKSNEVDGIYNCGDNDSEGQVLIDEILMACQNNKTTYRMILPDQTEKTILAEIDRKALNSEYKNFANEGFSRQRLDWLYGINTTVLLSVKSGELLNCGRLIVPIVKKVYDVDISIKNFIPTEYYQCESNINEIKLTVGEKFNTSLEAEKLAKILNEQQAIVEDIISKDVTKKPSKLFSLTSLQKYMNKHYKMKADEVLEICQSLYEKKYQTYPRTDGEYMSEEEKENVKEIIESLNDERLEFKDKKTIFDSSKVEAHSALIPTTQAPELNELSEKEKLIYNTICNRFKSNFCKEECIVSTSEMTIKCQDIVFKFTGEIIKQEGFMVYESMSKLKVLPNFKKGDIIDHDFKAVLKQTQPPKKMNQASLLGYLENPFKNHEEDEEIEVKELGLGTPATRAEIIKKCCVKYIEDKNNTLSITPLGIKLIETINKLGINLYADKTIQLSKNLKEVRAGNITLDECLNQAKAELKIICSNSKSIEIDKIDKKEREIIGKCPCCNSVVYENNKSFYCSNYKECKFSLWKEDKWFAARGKKITKSMANKLLSMKGVKMKFKSKNNNEYNAIVTMNINGKYPQFEMEFDKK